MTAQRVLFVTAACVFMVAASGKASACTCIVGLKKGFLFPRQGRVPANSRGIAWWGGGTTYGSVNALRQKVTFHVEREARGRFRPAAFRIQKLEPGVFLVQPSGGFKAGGTYRFRYTWGTIGDSVLVRVDRYVLKPKAVHPVLTAAATGSNPKLAVRAGGACSRTIRAATTVVEVKLPQVLRPYVDALFFSTIVDGHTIWRPATSYCHKVPPGSSWIGRGKDLIYSACAVYLGDNGLAAGEHTVRMEMWLPGTRVRIATHTLRFRLACK